jgi:ABC-type sugar transport system permease subunit
VGVKRLALEQKKALWGFIFVLPWLLGFIFLFSIPLIQSFQFSLSHLSMAVEGYRTEYAGLSNYREALFTHPTFNRIFVESISNMLVNVPLIILFSLFSATLLNQKFRGRILARAIFFLPVILASGALSVVSSNDFLSNVVGSVGQDEGGNFSGLRSFELENWMFQSGMSPVIIQYLTGAVDRIYEIISSSGVQILIFLAGLQSISPSIYEAAKMEGATGYEIFWKITFPMMSPLILTNVVYSIIDAFNNNKMTRLLNTTAFEVLDFSLSAAMAWMYFAVICLILAVFTALISRKVFYYD